MPVSKKVTDRGRDWYFKLLSSLYLATFLIRLSYGIITITFPDYTGIEENVSFGFLWAAGPIAEIFTVLFVGNLIDKYGRRWALLFGLLLGVISNYLIATSTNFAVLFSVTALHGAASGTILVTSLALLADYVPIHKRGREIGMFDGINLAGWGAGFFLGGLLKDYLSNELVWSFLMSGFLALIGFLYVFFNLHEPGKTRHVVKVLKATHIVSVLKRRSILLLVLPWFVIYMLIGNVFAFFPKASGQEFGFEGWVIGGALAVACIAIVMFQRGYGTLSDRIGRIKVMSIGISGIIILMLMFGVIYATIPNLEGRPVTDGIHFDSQGDLVNGSFIQGSGAIIDGTITSIGPDEMIFNFGPINLDETAIHRLQADWIGNDSIVQIQWTQHNITHRSVLPKGTSFEIGDRPSEILVIITLAGQGDSISELGLKVLHDPPPSDIMGELLHRPIIIGVMAISGIMSGAFAPAALASLADEAHSKSRGITMAIYIVMISLGQAVGPILNGFLLDNYGAMGFLLFLAGSGIFLGLVIFLKWLDQRTKKGPLSIDAQVDRMINIKEEE